MKLQLFLLLFVNCFTLWAADDFVSFTQPSAPALRLTGTSATVKCDEADYPGVLLAVKNLQTDLQAVTGSAHAPIVVGTWGKSSLIDKKAYAKELKGRNEKFIIDVQTDKIVIAGSDKRGTIYGVYELSRQLGVSPWYWWADVPIGKHAQVYARQGQYTDGEPAVKYRGIFLNDEWPCMGNWAHDTFGGFNHKMYEKVFELVLRLKGNFMWPAMWSAAFYADDPLNSKTADDMGIIMGTSHHEPCAKAHQEWTRVKTRGAWNYDTNRTELVDFWRSGIERMKDTEDVITIGMRGNGDEPMADKPDVALMERIVAHQRKLIAEATGKKAKDVPQVWALYKEVQQYYEMGMKVPDDVILLLCDDNWGNVRMLPQTRPTQTPSALSGTSPIMGRKPSGRLSRPIMGEGRGEGLHPGGYGLYYHVDYVGAPRNSKWLNVSQVQRLWEQLDLTYRSGIDKLWILNVGDLKPMEFPIDFWFKEAWNPSQFSADNLMAYTEDFCRQQFGEAQAKEAARILNLQCKYAHRRTAEQMAKNTYSLANGEWDERLAEYKSLEADALAQYLTLSAEYRDAYNELILFPVRAIANIYEMYYAQAKNEQLAGIGDPAANVWADRVVQCFRKDSLLCADYNHNIAGGKWNHMMDEIHIGYVSWNNPRRNMLPAVKRVDPANPVIAEQDGKVIIDADCYAAKTDAQKAKWTVIPDFGIYKSAMALMPYSEKTDGSSISYRFKTAKTAATMTFVFAPNFPFNDVRNGMQLNYAMDGGTPVTLNTNGSAVIRFNNATGDQQFDWAKERVNRRKVQVTLPATADGVHTLTLSPLDAGIVIERIIIE